MSRTRADIAAARLEELIVEAQAIRHETAGKQPAVAARRFEGFTTEVETLARECLRHVRSMEARL